MSKFSKKGIALLFLQFLTLVLMLIPYSVPEKATRRPGGEVIAVVVNEYAYFSRNSLSYGGFVPFISGLACVAAVILLFFVLFGKKEGNKIGFCFLAAIFISFAASAATFFIFKTLLSGIITGILLVSCVLSLLRQSTDLL